MRIPQYGKITKTTKTELSIWSVFGSFVTFPYCAIGVDR